LPNRLWATTGLTLDNFPRYQSFGRLRNTIQHFTSPDADVSLETIDFIYEVIDPFIHRCWGLFAVDYNEDYEHPKYLAEGLIRRGIRFLVSPEVIQEIEKGNIEFDWPEGDDAYKKDIEARIAEARRKWNKERSKKTQ
jgi:hypothetical protein